MQKRVESLANFMRSKLKRGQKYVLMLGAGASYDSGVPPTETMIAELVREYGQAYKGSVDEKFDELWREASVDERVAMLEPYWKDKTPSIGYHKLVELVKNGYFDLILTFNFDHLLEDALDKASFDYRVIINGDVKEERILELLRNPEPRVKVLKLHGDLKSKVFAFSKDEILEYHTAVKKVVTEHSMRDIIICGYAFNDLNVIRAFSDYGGSIYFVNPAGAGDNIRGFLVNRRSKNKVIKGEAGKFDNFCRVLSDELRRMETEEEAIGLADELLELRERHRRLYIWKELHHLLQRLDAGFKPVRLGIRQKEPTDIIEKALQPSIALISKEIVPFAEGIEYPDFLVNDCITDLKQKLKEIDEALESPLSLYDRVLEFAGLVGGYLDFANDGLGKAKDGLDDLAKEELPKRLREIENRLGEDDAIAMEELVRAMGDFIEGEGRLLEWGELHNLYNDLKWRFEAICLDADNLDFVKERWSRYQTGVLDKKLVRFGKEIEYIDEAKTWIAKLIKKGEEIDGALDSPELLREAIMKFNELIGQHFRITDDALKQTVATLDDLAARIQEGIER